MQPITALNNIHIRTVLQPGDIGYIIYLHGTLQQAGCTSSYLWTTNELPAAAALYKKHGFVLTDEMPSNAFGKPLIEQRYQLNLQ